MIINPENQMVSEKTNVDSSPFNEELSLKEIKPKLDKERIKRKGIKIVEAGSARQKESPIEIVKIPEFYMNEMETIIEELDMELLKLCFEKQKRDELNYHVVSKGNRKVQKFFSTVGSIFEEKSFPTSRYTDSSNM